jgi:hypothetical protein
MGRGVCQGRGGVIVSGLVASASERHGRGDDHRRAADHALLAQPTCRPAQLAQTVHASTRSRQGSGTAGRRERDVIPRPVADASSSPTPPTSAASSCSVVTQSRTGSLDLTVVDGRTRTVPRWPCPEAVGLASDEGAGCAPRSRPVSSRRRAQAYGGAPLGIDACARWSSRSASFTVARAVRPGLERRRSCARIRHTARRAMDQELERLEFDARDAVASQLRGRHGGELAHAGGNRCSWREARRGLRSPSPG